MQKEQIVNNGAVAVVHTPSALVITAAGQAQIDRARVAFIIDVVALATGIPAVQISSPTRCNAKAARARQIAMYLAYVAYTWPLARIGAAFGRDRTTVGYACRLVEDLRDDTAFDRRLERMETCVRNAPEPREMTLLSPNLMAMAWA